MTRTVRLVLAYGALGGLLLVCLRILSLAPLAVDWGREVAAAVITLVAVVIGMRLAAREPAPAPVPPLVSGEPPIPVANELLSPREQQILVLLADGLTNKELAQALFVSENTVKTHLAHLYEKLGVGRRTEALAAARRRGLLPG